MKEYPGMGYLTDQQYRVISSPGIKYLGRDHRYRPVVEGMVGIPQQLLRWAVLKSGDPADIVEPITEGS